MPPLPIPKSTHGRPSVRSTAEIYSTLVEVIDSARVAGCPSQMLRWRSGGHSPTPKPTHRKLTCTSSKLLSRQFCPCHWVAG